MESFLPLHAERMYNTISMDGDEPATGQWNHDADNRKNLKDHRPVKPLTFDKRLATQLIKKHEIKTIGTMDRERLAKLTRAECLKLLTFFLSMNALENFGTFGRQHGS
jgi:deoxyribodipyrimidine photolyase-related protein